MNGSEVDPAKRLNGRKERTARLRKLREEIDKLNQEISKLNGNGINGRFDFLERETTLKTLRNERSRVVKERNALLAQ